VAAATALRAARTAPGATGGAAADVVTAAAKGNTGSITRCYVCCTVLPIKAWGIGGARGHGSSWKKKCAK